MKEQIKTYLAAWPMYLFALCVTLLILAPRPLHTVHNVIVLRNLAPFKYELVYEDGEKAGTPWVQHICDDYYTDGPNWLEDKGFSAGLILDEITFIDRGGCWSLNPDEQASFFNRKDRSGNYVRREETTTAAGQR